MKMKMKVLIVMLIIAVAACGCAPAITPSAIVTEASVIQTAAKNTATAGVSTAEAPSETAQCNTDVPTDKPTEPIQTPTQTITPEPEGFLPVVRFVITTDLHIPACMNQIMKQVYAYAGTQNYSALDALIVAGDINQDTDAAGIKAYKDAVALSVKGGTDIITCMGNHEFMKDTENWQQDGIKYYTQEEALECYDEMTGQEPNRHVTINGIHIIAWSPKISGASISYAENISWLEEQLRIAAAASKTNPIFVIQHYPVRNTSYINGSSAMTVSSLDKANEIFSRYPQIINLTGHTHNPLAFATAIVQTKYTSVHCGMGAGWGAAIDSVGLMENVQSAQQMLIAEVDAKGETRLIVWDTGLNAPFYDEPWTITPLDPNFRYTAEKRKSSTTAPEFPQNAKVSIGSITSSGVQLTFNSASCNAGIMQNDVYYYTIIIYKEGKQAGRRYMFANGHIKQRKDIYSCKIDNLEPGTEYTFRVYAVDAYYRKCTKFIEASAATK